MRCGGYCRYNRYIRSTESDFASINTDPVEIGIEVFPVPISLELDPEDFRTILVNGKRQNEGTQRILQIV